MPQPSEAVSIDVVSDIVCPWCFIGKKRIEKAIALVPHIPVRLRFHPYFLNDWIPRGGISREDYLTKKFGSVARYGEIAKRVQAAAAEEGLVYNIEKISRQPNTTDAHRLILWAGERGPQMKQRLMDLYFTEGADLTDANILVQAAADVGLPRDDVAERLSTEDEVDLVTRAAQSAKEAGIDGVPCFIFGNALAVSGAQAPEQLANAIERAAAELEKREGAPAAV
jgi:predicted DsbA family dithiol-disulfide isomerase